MEVHRAGVRKRRGAIRAQKAGLRTQGRMRMPEAGAQERERIPKRQCGAEAGAQERGHIPERQRRAEAGVWERERIPKRQGKTGRDG